MKFIRNFVLKSQHSIFQIYNFNSIQTENIVFLLKILYNFFIIMTENKVQIQNSNKKQQIWSNKYIAIGIVACFGGLIHQLITGALYQWGIINIYVTSYYKTIDPSVTLQSNAIAFPIMMFCMGLPMRFGIYLAELSHPLIMLVGCQILLSLSVFIASFMTNMWAFIFFYGILFGLLVGSAFMISIIEVNKYFPGKKMFVNGAILIGTGSGSVVFGMFSYTFLNPEHLKPLAGYYVGTPQLEQIVGRVPSLLKYLALMYLLLGLLGIAMITPVILENKKKQNQALQKQLQKKRQNQRNGIVSVPETQNKNIHEAKTLCEAFSSLVCWIQVAIVFLTATGLYLMNGNYKTYVKKSIDDDYFLTIIGALGAVCNGCSRFIWNVVFSKTGFKTVMLMIIGISISAYSTIRFTVNMKQIYLIEMLLINFCIGGLLVVTPTVAQAIYGQKTGSNIYGFYWEVVATANFVQYLFVSNLSKTIGFDIIIYICLGMAGLAIPLVIFTKFQGPWHNQTTVLQYCVGVQVSKAIEQQQHTLQQFHEHLMQQRLIQQKSKQKNATQIPSKPLKLNPLSAQYLLTNQKKISSTTKQEIQMSNTQLFVKPQIQQQSKLEENLKNSQKTLQKQVNDKINSPQHINKETHIITVTKRSSQNQIPTKDSE